MSRERGRRKGCSLRWATAIALLVVVGVFLHRRLADTRLLLDRSTRVAQLYRPGGVSLSYGGRISNREALLVEQGVPGRAEVTAVDMVTRQTRGLPGLSAFLARRVHDRQRHEVTVCASPRGDRVIWCDDVSAGFCDLDGGNAQPIDTGILSQHTHRCSAQALWSPDGELWAIASLWRGEDSSGIEGVRVGVVGSVAARSRMGPDSGAFGLTYLCTGTLTASGTLLACDIGVSASRPSRGVYAIDPAARSVRPAAQTGVSAPADAGDCRATSDGHLVWLEETGPDWHRRSIASWLRDLLHIHHPSVAALSVSNLDGSGVRAIGRVVEDDEHSGVSLLGVSPDGKWADYECGGWLYTVRVP